MVHHTRRRLLAGLNLQHSLIQPNPAHAMASLTPFEHIQKYGAEKLDAGTLSILQQQGLEVRGRLALQMEAARSVTDRDWIASLTQDQADNEQALRLIAEVIGAPSERIERCAATTLAYEARMAQPVRWDSPKTKLRR